MRDQRYIAESDVESFSMPVDYRKCVRDLFCEFQAMYSPCVRETSPPGFLHASGSGMPWQSHYDLPPRAPNIAEASRKFGPSWPFELYDVDRGTNQHENPITADHHLKALRCKCGIVTQVERGIDTIADSQAPSKLVKDHRGESVDSQKPYRLECPRSRL